MGLTRRDAAATALTGLAVLVFAATHQGWNVWLVGGSHRWAAGVIAVLGIATCALGTPQKDRSTALFAVLGIAALVLTVLALVTGSLTALSFLVVADVALWALATIVHATHAPRKPLAV